MANAGDVATKATRDKLTLHVGSDSFNLGAGTLQSNQRGINWPNSGLTWADGDSVAVKITGPHSSPNAYGYRTIWTALMTAEVNPNLATRFGYVHEFYGTITNDTIVDRRTDRGLIINEFRYPWSGYVIESLAQDSSSMDLKFLTNDYPTADEVAEWTLSLGGGIELPFAKATNDALTPNLWLTCPPKTGPVINS